MRTTNRLLRPRTSQIRNARFSSATINREFRGCWAGARDIIRRLMPKRGAKIIQSLGKRANRTCGVLGLNLSGYPTNQDLASHGSGAKALQRAAEMSNV